MIPGLKLLEPVASLLTVGATLSLNFKQTNTQFTPRLQKVVFEIIMLPEVERHDCYFEGS